MSKHKMNTEQKKLRLIKTKQQSKSRKLNVNDKTVKRRRVFPFFFGCEEKYKINYVHPQQMLI